MAQKGIKREEISATSAVLYGAAAGYAVSHSPFCENPVLTVWPGGPLLRLSCGPLFTP